MTATLDGPEEVDAEVAGTARGGAVNLVGQAVNMVLSLATVVLVTREYGAAGAGLFFTAIAIFTIVGTIAKLGSETGLVFTISHARAGARWQDIVPTIRIALFPVIVLAAVAGIALYGGVGLLNDGGHHTADGTLADVLRVLAVFLPAFVAGQVLTGATRGYGDMVCTTRDLNIIRPLLQMILMAGVVVAHQGLVALALAWSLPLLLTLFTATASLLRHLRNDPDAEGTPAVGLTREFWRYASVRGFAQTLQTTQDRIGIVMVGAYAGAATAGLFVVVARIIGGLNLVVYAIGQALNPQIGGLLAAGRKEGVERVLHRITGWTMLLVWPMAILLITHGDVVLGLFGPEFTDGGGALELLSLAIIVSTAFCHLDNVLLMGGRAWLSLANVVFSLIVMTALYAVLIPRYDLGGAALAWAIGILVYNIGPWWPVRRAMGIKAFGNEALFVAPSCLGAFIAASLVRVLFGSGLGATVGAFVAAGLVYLVGVRQYAGPLKVSGLWRLFLPAPAPCATPSGTGTTVSEERATGSDVA
jgi:O-antigen/teichoic acid export membrane protein